MMKTLCRGCMREEHPGISCQEAGLQTDFGKVVRRPPRCKKCSREHWQFDACSLRSRAEEEVYRQATRR